MFEIWIEESGQDVHRQILSWGRFHLGRSSENEIHVANSNVSRKHLRLDVSDDAILITDLGSTNGTQLKKQTLTPYESTNWPIGESVYIGRLIMHIIRLSDSTAASQNDESRQPKTSDSISPSQGTRVASIICPRAVQQVTTLSSQPIYIGHHASCAIRITAAKVASHHCLLQRRPDHVEVTNLDTKSPAKLDGKPLPPGQPEEWAETAVLQVGDAVCHLTFDIVDSSYGEFSGQLPFAVSSRARGLIRYGLMAAVLVSLFCICLVVALSITANRVGCESPSPACLIAALGSGPSGSDGDPSSGEPTPTLASQSTSQADSGNYEQIIEFATETPAPTSTPEECLPEDESAGWLDLPFPYHGVDIAASGTPEEFRRISQRSRFGGRINSFFDHEYPVYPPSFGGREPSERAATLVTFNGGRSIDAYSQDSETADWYSGHPGIDFSPANPREATTPILAAAEGRLTLATIDNDGNHLVRLEHDPDGDGIYQFTTYYYHLHPDDYFNAMLDLEEGTPIMARQRIGTMGTTGRSTGIHLHFEVRYDRNRDGWFSILEKVDPYGYFPSQEIPVDPWSMAISWIDSGEETIEHEGITSDYLWVHSLVDIDDERGDCAEVSRVNVDLNLYPVLGYAVINPGFTYIARNESGEVLREGQSQLRRITILAENLEGVDVESIGLEYLDPELDVWFSVSEDKELVQNPSGDYTFSATIRKTGRYVLVGRELVDRVAPITTINLEGENVGQDAYTYNESVVITLDPVDRGLITSAIKTTQFSLDCGKSWITYDGPFTVTKETPHACGEEGTGLQGIEFGLNDFLLLTLSEDVENNIEQPPGQVRFRLQ